MKPPVRNESKAPPPNPPLTGGELLDRVGANSPPNPPLTGGELLDRVGANSALITGELLLNSPPVKGGLGGGDSSVNFILGNFPNLELGWLVAYFCAFPLSPPNPPLTGGELLDRVGANSPLTPGELLLNSPPVKGGLGGGEYPIKVGESSVDFILDGAISPKQLPQNARHQNTLNARIINGELE